MAKIDDALTDSDQSRPTTTVAMASLFHTMSDLNLYSLMSSDTHGALLTYIKLCKTNYDQWLNSFLGALKVKLNGMFYCWHHKTLAILGFGGT